MNEPTGLDPKLTAVNILESDKMPSHCAFCDAPTGRFVKIIKSRRERGSDGVLGTVLFGSAALFLALFGFLFFRFGGSRQFERLTIRLKLPQCDRCAKQGPPEPRHADFHHGELTFVVNREFKRRLFELNPGQRSAV